MIPYIDGRIICFKRDLNQYQFIYSIFLIDLYLFKSFAIVNFNANNLKKIQHSSI
jgi:hypothetical protein